MDPSLYEAAMWGDIGFFTRTVGNGDELIDLLHQKTPKDNNVLHIAAEYKQNKFFEEIPLDSQSPLFWATNKKGETPLLIAARVGCSEVAEFLINHAKTLQFRGADQESGEADSEAHKKLLRMTNFDKDTALHIATRYGRGGVAILLIESDPQLCCFTNSTNESPLFLAVGYGFQLIAASILNRPVSPSFQGINGVTALHAAVTHSNRKAKHITAVLLPMSIGGMMAAFASGTFAFLSKGSTQNFAVIIVTPIAMFFGSIVIIRLETLSTFTRRQEKIGWLRRASI
ncbi:hypothetical protein ACFX2F_004191 [Malus domestica]